MSIRRHAAKRARSSWRSVLRAARPHLRNLLIRYARGRSRAEGPDAHRRVTFILSSAWGMGGTIRAVHNAAHYLAATHQVEILSLVRMRDDAFFGNPPGVRITALDDMRPDAVARPLRRLRDLLSSKETLLLDSQDRPAENASLWMDLQLVRRLRGRTGFLIGTRPGLNLPHRRARPARRHARRRGAVAPRSAFP